MTTRDQPSASSSGAARPRAASAKGAMRVAVGGAQRRRPGGPSSRARSRALRVTAPSSNGVDDASCKASRAIAGRGPCSRALALGPSSKTRAQLVGPGDRARRRCSRATAHAPGARARPRARRGGARASRRTSAADRRVGRDRPEPVRVEPVAGGRRQTLRRRPARPATASEVRACCTTVRASSQSSAVGSPVGMTSAAIERRSDRCAAPSTASSPSCLGAEAPRPPRPRDGAAPHLGRGPRRRTQAHRAAARRTHAPDGAGAFARGGNTMAALTRAKPCRRAAKSAGNDPGADVRPRRAALTARSANPATLSLPPATRLQACAIRGGLAPIPRKSPRHQALHCALAPALRPRQPGGSHRRPRRDLRGLEGHAR